MQTEAEIRVYQFKGNVPEPRKGQVQEGDGNWTSPSPEDLQEARVRRWALTTRHAPRAKAILMAGTCEVCHGDLVRSHAVTGDLLIITPWLHRYAAQHEPVLADPRRSA